MLLLFWWNLTSAVPQTYLGGFAAEFAVQDFLAALTEAKVRDRIANLQESSPLELTRNALAFARGEKLMGVFRGI